MNWKLIWKYTGLIIAATLVVGFLFGLINGFYAGAGTPTPFGLVVFTGLANVTIITVGFAKLSIEQREHTILHALAVFLLCVLIPLPFNVGLLGQPLVEWAAANVVLLVTAAVGIGCGTFLRPRQLKSEAEERRFVVIKDNDARVKTGKIQICLPCGVKNRLSKAVLIGLKPVCGKCGGALQDIVYPSEFIDSEYVDVDSTTFQYESWKTNIYEPQAARASETYEPKQPAPIPQDVSAPYEEKADDELMNKLFVRLLQDREKAFRIVNSLKQKHPTRSERWCWEKAIDDLDRDRR